MLGPNGNFMGTYWELMGSRWGLVKVYTDLLGSYMGAYMEP